MSSSILKSLLRTAFPHNKLLPKLLGEITEITLVSSDKVYVAAHRGITCADSHAVGFRCHGFTALFEGTRLVLEAVAATEAVLTGNIERITFSTDSKGGNR